MPHTPVAAALELTTSSSPRFAPPRWNDACVRSDGFRNKRPSAAPAETPRGGAGAQLERARDERLDLGRRELAQVVEAVHARTPARRRAPRPSARPCARLQSVSGGERRSTRGSLLVPTSTPRSSSASRTSRAARPSSSTRPSRSPAPRTLATGPRERAPRAAPRRRRARCSRKPGAAMRRATSAAAASTSGPPPKVEPSVPCVACARDALARDREADRQAAGRALRGREDVGHDAEVLRRPERAEPAVAGLHLVEDEQRAARASHAARSACEEARRRLDDARERLDRLEDHRARRCASIARARRGDVAERHAPHLEGRARERRFLPSRDRRGGRRAAVEGAREARPPSRAAWRRAPSLSAFSFASAPLFEQNTRQLAAAGRLRSKAARNSRARRVVEQVRRERERAPLARERAPEAGVAGAERVDAVPAVEVEHAPAVREHELAALGARRTGERQTRVDVELAQRHHQHTPSPTRGQSGRLGQPEHQVQALQRLAGAALDRLSSVHEHVQHVAAHGHAERRAVRARRRERRSGDAARRAPRRTARRA